MLDLESAIRSRAYEIWQTEGEVHGRDVTHWLTAEEEIKGAVAATVTGAVAGAVAPASKPQRTRKAPADPAAGKPKASTRKPAKARI